MSLYCHDSSPVFLQWFADYLGEIQLEESKRANEAEARGETYNKMIDIRVFLTSVSQSKVRIVSLHMCCIDCPCLCQDDLATMLFHIGIQEAQEAQEQVGSWFA